MKRFAGIVVALLVVSAGVLPAATAGATVSSSVAAGGHLGPGDTLSGGESLAILDGRSRFRLVMQGDGNLVLYDQYDNDTARWWTGTAGHPGARLEVQTDGNLVVYSPVDDVLWASNTAGRVGRELAMQADGNLVYYGTDGLIWSSATDDPTVAPEPGKIRPTEGLAWPRPQCPGVDLPNSISSPNGVYSLYLQLDTNLVLYKNKEIPLWSTGPLAVDPPLNLQLTFELSRSGDLTVGGSLSGDADCRYGGVGYPVLWSAHTGGARMPHLHVQNDGNVVLYAYDQPVWQTGTAVR